MSIKPLKKRSTTIHEDVRRMLGISRDIYAFCAYVHYRCADSRQKRSGWCCDNKQDVADFVGVTRRGLFKMAERVQEIGLIETSGSGDYRTTPKWIDAESKREQSSQNKEADTGNKVPKKREQSSQKNIENGNKVPNRTLYTEIENKIEGERTPPAPESQNLKEEKNESGLVAPGRLDQHQYQGQMVGQISEYVATGLKEIKQTFETVKAEPSAFDKYGVQPLEIMEGETFDEIEARTFQVTAIASPTDTPGVTLVEFVKTRAENTLEAEQMITGWIEGEGEQTVKHRYNTAKQRFDPANAAAIAAHYCSVYTKTAANKGRLLADPITHFSDGLFSYLKNEETFGRNNQPGNQTQVRNGTQQPQSTLPKFLQNQIGK